MARVLLVDESATVQRAVSSVLADEGIEVVTASDGREAIELLDRSAADLLITGLSLPALSGEELCRHIKSSRRLGHVPVILLVGAFEPLDPAETRRIGADAQLPKPPQSRQLIQTVRGLLEKSNNRASLTPLLGREEGLHAQEATDNQGEGAKPQSVFFKPYKPPAKLTPEQLSLEVRALPARVESNKLERKTERAPEGAAVILMTALAIVIAVALAVWLLTRQGDTDPQNLSAAQQAAAVESEPAASDQPAPSNNEIAEARAAAPVGSIDGKPQAERAAVEPPPNAVTKRERSSSVEEDDRESFAPAPSTSLMREQMLLRARSYEDRGMLAQAELQYRAVLHNFPGDSTARFALSRIEAQRAAAIREQDARTSRETGLRAFRSGNYSEAVMNLTAAMNAGRGDTIVLYSLGMAQWKLGRNREAQSTFERCLVSNPNYAPAMVGLAQVKAAEGKRAEAVALLNRALQLGGGAEFSPDRIREMIARYTPRPK
ncbi:MAG TPA: response regulator [Blastocatellia bacterium]|nr:response regulator [Blastocatellia bacterium]